MNMKLRDDMKEEIIARALVILAGTLVLLVLSLSGCGEQPLPVNVAGAWSYTWVYRDTGATWHGTMELAQEGEQVTGSIGFPVDYPSDDIAAARAAWVWSMDAVVVGDFVPLAAIPTPNQAVFLEPWWFDMTVDGDTMGGPAFGGVERKPGYSFAAVRRSD
jgi:hypothetical protein